MKNSLGVAANRTGSLIKDMAWVLLAIFLGNQLLMMARETFDPFSNYIEPRWLFIPDHCEGDDPVISYSREIHKPFEGSFGGAFSAADGQGFPVCPDGRHPWGYVKKPGAILTMKLSAFTSSACLPPAGKWQRVELFEGYLPQRHTMRHTLVSNAFTVWPKSDPHCQKP